MHRLACPQVASQDEKLERFAAAQEAQAGALEELAGRMGRSTQWSREPNAPKLGALSALEGLVVAAETEARQARIRKPPTPRCSSSQQGSWSNKNRIDEFVAELVLEGVRLAYQVPAPDVACVYTVQMEGPRLDAAAAAKQNEVLRGPDGAWRQLVVQMSGGEEVRLYVMLDRSKTHRVRSGALRVACRALESHFPSLDLRVVQREGMVAIGLLPVLTVWFNKDMRDVEYTWKVATIDKHKLDAEAIAAALP